MGCSCRTFREVKKAPASHYRGLRSDQSELDALISFPKHEPINGGPKNAGRCPKKHKSNNHSARYSSHN
jgi:hypothetical protein